MRLDSFGPRTWLLAGVAGWAVCLWVFALVGLGGRLGPLPDDVSPQRLPATKIPAAERPGPQAQYQAIALRPIFSENRQPQAFRIGGATDDAKANTFDFLLTSVLIAGGTMANTCASRIIPIMAPVMRPAISCADASRSLQSFRRTKPMPEFWLLPAKLKPATVNTPATSGCLRMKSAAMSIDCSVRCWVAPGGVVNITIIMPWSSSGRNDDGSRQNSRPITASATT